MTMGKSNGNTYLSVSFWESSYSGFLREWVGKGDIEDNFEDCDAS